MDRVNIAPAWWWRSVLLPLLFTLPFSDAAPRKNINRQRQTPFILVRVSANASIVVSTSFKSQFHDSKSIAGSLMREVVSKHIRLPCREIGCGQLCAAPTSQFCKRVELHKRL